MMMKIGLLQYAFTPRGEENLQKVFRLLNQICKQGPDFVILPEMWLGAPSSKKERMSWALFYQKALASLRKWCADSQIGCVFSQLEYFQGHFYNTAYVIDPKGKLKTKYRKIHLFSRGGENKIYHPGTTPTVFSWKGVKIGLIICYDLRFPELIRHLTLKGVKLLIVCAQWPHTRRLHWMTLLKARAIENQFFVAATNRLGKKEKLRYHGDSLVIGPWGDIKLHLGPKQQTGVATISFKELKEIRRQWPFLKEKRL